MVEAVEAVVSWWRWSQARGGGGRGGGGDSEDCVVAR